MNFPLALLTLRWLIRDTFRQARASGIFWLMLGTSALCILFCLSAGVKPGEPLAEPGMPAEFLPRSSNPAAEASYKKKLAYDGVVVVGGEVTLGFGAWRLPLGRDAEDSLRGLLLILAGGVGGAAGLLLCLTWTAGFLPAFLEPSAAAVLLAKPVSRGWLLCGKYLAVLTFVAFQAAVFVGGTWLAVGLATGVWIPEYLLCVPILFLHFAVMYSMSALLAVCTRSTVACVFGSVMFWLLCWGLNYGRHVLVTLPQAAPDLPVLPPAFTGLVETTYWLLPKPADLTLLLENTLQVDRYFGAVPAFQAVQATDAFWPVLSVLSSLAFAAAVLAVAVRQLAHTDY